jgi:hypothetical protein
VLALLGPLVTKLPHIPPCRGGGLTGQETRGVERARQRQEALRHNRDSPETQNLEEVVRARDQPEEPTLRDLVLT